MNARENPLQAGVQAMALVLRSALSRFGTNHAGIVKL
jgi:hypothetical protein